MTARHDTDEQSTEDAAALLDRARAHRREEDRRLSMSERLARVHELCRQMGMIAGAARRR